VEEEEEEEEEPRRRRKKRRRRSTPWRATGREGVRRVPFSRVARRGRLAERVAASVLQ
jgi:hypothetical protein